ncbi:MAG: class II aldolase/adducin family protein [Candidatus Calescibacterium sp.]|nr:class II aldolase/adducin family protein [Candidatus Calescibacterium sp.]MDW8132280.1 class II aldolase/adducin family protein [Candidatus Calescibacterium sp.]
MFFQEDLDEAWKKIKFAIDELGDRFFPSTSGNISIRIGDLVYCTPTSVRKRNLVRDMISVVNFENELLGGFKQTSEINLHLELYKNFEDVNFVVHTHPMYCVIFSCTNRKIKLDLLPEYYVKIRQIVYVKYVTPGTEILAFEVVKNIKKILGNVKEGVVILRNHGLVVFSYDFKRCVDLTFCVEEIAKINYFLLILGNHKRIPRKMLSFLSKYFY